MPHDPRLIRAKEAIRRAKAYNYYQLCDRVAFWSAVTFFICVPLFIAGVYLAVVQSEFYGSVVLFPAMIVGLLSGLAYPQLLLLRNMFSTGRVPRGFSLRTLLIATTLVAVMLGAVIYAVR